MKRMMRIDVHKLLNQLAFDKNDPLLFNSAFFLIFFGFFLTAYLLFQKTKNARIYFLTLFSLYFFYKNLWLVCWLYFTGSGGRF
jgi:alginate O-acetyltransferase complex protein AlgI